MFHLAHQVETTTAKIGCLHLETPLCSELSMLISSVLRPFRVISSLFIYSILLFLHIEHACNCYLVQIACLHVVDDCLAGPAQRILRDRSSVAKVLPFQFIHWSSEISPCEAISAKRFKEAGCMRYCYRGVRHVLPSGHCSRLSRHRLRASRVHHGGRMGLVCSKGRQFLWQLYRIGKRGRTNAAAIYSSGKRVKSTQCSTRG